MHQYLMFSPMGRGAESEILSACAFRVLLTGCPSESATLLPEGSGARATI